MNIYVLIKNTLNTKKRIQVSGHMVPDRKEPSINYYDKCAIQEAIKMRDDFGGKVTVVTIGDKGFIQLQKALAMGADQAVLINSEDKFKVKGFSSNLSTLEDFFRSRNVDIILSGNISVDDPIDQSSAHLADKLNFSLQRLQI